mmetsp:Transcript_38029/g.92538  ORF Transcript_38029/g.92538 Transcript_38029/m.92538 type:complete len:105 (+) Transcript_38029:1448-1762(+)
MKIVTMMQQEVPNALHNNITRAIVLLPLQEYCLQQQHHGTKSEQHIFSDLVHRRFEKNGFPRRTAHCIVLDVLGSSAGQDELVLTSIESKRSSPILPESDRRLK